MTLKPKAALRTLLGTHAYRVVTQTPRYVRFLLKPRREKETALLPLLIRPGDYCFDIGANYGQYTREIAPLLKEGRLFAFEPSRINRMGLRATVRWFGLRNTAVVAYALADAEGTQVLHIPVKAHGGLGIALAHLGQPTHAETVTETVQVTTLDAFMRAHAIPRCDFIKCDAEGSELSMLKGAGDTIRRFRPVIHAEVWSMYLQRHQHCAADIGAYMRALNYRAFVCQDGTLVPVDGDVQDRCNNVFIPEEKIARFAGAIAPAASPWKEAS